jgi:multimeric flavodoxin WrbA
LKTIIINASPRKKWNTAEVLDAARKGAESVGSEVEYVNLYDLVFKGCRSCLICKRKDKTKGKCYWKDEVSPLIERILDSDCLIIATPIFFTEPTSHYRALIERLIYCIVSFKTGNTFNGKINVGLMYSMEYSVKYFEESVRPHLKQSEGLLEMFNGKVMFSSSRIITNWEYKQSLENEELKNKLKLKENQFLLDLEKAFNMGVELCS